MKRLTINFDDSLLYQCEFTRQCCSIKILDGIGKVIVYLDAGLSARSRAAPLVLRTFQKDAPDVESRTFHRIVIRMGQNSSRGILSTRNMHHKDLETTLSDKAKDSLALFTVLLDNLLPQHAQSLLHKDIFGRSPLHYASQYGLAEVCQIILQHIQIREAPGSIALAHAILSLDYEGHTPLHLAVTNGHTSSVSALLEFLHVRDVALETMTDMDVCTTLAKLTNVTIRSNFTEINKLFLETYHSDVNYQAENGGTNLFVAAQFCRETNVKMLIESPGLHELDLNLAENGYGWTPLIVACVQGHQSVVEILLDAGADQSICDVFGWTARDHTAFRGFWSIGKLLAATPLGSSPRFPKIQLRETNALPPCNVNETRIFVNIRTLNTHEPKHAVDMDLYFDKLPYMRLDCQLGSALWVPLDRLV